MNRRVIKWGIVGALLAGTATGVYSFHAASPEAVTLPEIIRATQETPWAHASAIGYGLSLPGFREFWIGFDAKVVAGRMPDGKLSFYNFKELQMMEYDPNSRTTSLFDLEEQESSSRMLSLLLSVGNMQQMLTSCGGKTVVRRGDYRGREVQVQQTSLSVRGKRIKRYVVRFYIDPQSKLLQAADVSTCDAAGSIVTTGQIVFDYPQTGPRDICDLGVPREARIVNQVPPDDWRNTWEQYQRIRADRTKEYIAVIAYHDLGLGDVVTAIDVDYKLGLLQRQERHLVFGKDEPFDRFQPARKGQLGESFGPLLAWTREHYNERGRIWIHLRDGPYEGWAHRNNEGLWSRERDTSAEGDGPDPLATLADLAWPHISSEARVVADDYSRENGLLCVETLTQGRVADGKVLLPTRFSYCLDPQRDYICWRYTVESCSDAAWQEDKNWLAGIDPEKVGDDSITVRVITDAARAADGHWYPTTIVEQSSGVGKDFKDAALKTCAVKQVYLTLTPNFVKGTFDMGKLPG